MARFSFLSTAVVGLVAAAVANAQATINTPTGLVTCQPSLIKWTGGAAPYYVTVIPGGEPNGAVLKTLVDGGSEMQYTWQVDLPAGTSITVQVKDASGTPNYTDKVTIGAGSDTSCVNNNVVVGGASSAAGGAASSAAAGPSAAASSGMSVVASASSRVSGAAAAASSAATSATPGSDGQATIGGRSAVGALIVAAAAVAALA